MSGVARHHCLLGAESSARLKRPLALAPLLAVACAAVLWTASLQDIDLSPMTDLGLVSLLPISAYAGLGILTVSFCMVVHRRRAPAAILFLHVVVLIAMIHGTPAILYGTLRYSWAWKHVGIVDYIQRHGSVNPEISLLGAYHNWPGFFVVSALITEIAGFKSPLSFASWAPAFFNLLFVGALLLIMKTFTRDQRLVWLSVWFFELTNWVGQDYFSPQAFTYFLYLLILGLCLRWFRVTTPPSKVAMKRWLRFDRAVSLFHGLVARVGSGEEPDATLGPLQRLGLMGVVILLYAVVAVSHQLTPLMTILSVSALVAFQLCSARSLPILMTVLAVSWMVYMAEGFLQGNLYWIVQSIGLLTNNVSSNLIDLAAVSPGQKFIAIVGRGLSALVGSLALLGSIRRLREGYWDLSPILLMIAPFPMLAANSYGGEILFRIYFFALPLMAFLAAALLYPCAASGTSWRTVAVAVLLSGTLLGGLCVAYYGKERMFYFTQNEVDASRYLYDVAPPGALFVAGSLDWPAQYKNYEIYDYLALTSLLRTERSRLGDDPVGVISRLMGDQKYHTTYLIITRSQKAEYDMTGLMPAGSLDKIEKSLRQSGRFQVVYENPDATIFTLSSGTEPLARGRERPAP